MAKYRLYPTDAQQSALLAHCAHARFVWNLAVDQQSNWSVTRRNAPTSNERFRQLTEARGEFDWLREGSAVVQQQALRDFDQAMRNFFNGTHGRPTFRKKHLHNGFRIVDTGLKHIRRLNRSWSEVFVPKIGWVRFRWTRTVPHFKSYRVSMDRSGRWHVAFAYIPVPIPAPMTGGVVGVDRGVMFAVALSNGETRDFDSKLLDVPIKRLQQKMARQKKGSNRRAATRLRLAKLQARKADRRKDFVEQTTTMLAREFDLIRIEDLKVKQMTRSAKGTVEQPGRNIKAKSGLNRSILDKGWGMLAQRLQEKAQGRVELVPAAYTSLRCSACGHIELDSRKNQAEFTCVVCGFSANADVNAAINIAEWPWDIRVSARGGIGLPVPMNCEPQSGPPSMRAAEILWL